MTRFTITTCTGPDDGGGIWKVVVNFLRLLTRFIVEKDYYLSDTQLLRFRSNLADYQWAADMVGGIPPLALAAINYRETGGRRTTKRRGGWPQMDWSGATVKTLQERAAKICKRYRVPVGKLATDFRTGCIVCAHILKMKSKNHPIYIEGILQAANLAWTEWAYNGRSAYHTPSGKKNINRRHWAFSSYVSNNPKIGIVLQLRGTLPGKKGKRIKVNRPDKRPGARIIFDELNERLGYMTP